MEIPIVFITDNGYVLPTAVAITSLVKSKKPQTIYEIFVIITKDMTEENRNKLLECGKERARVNLIEFDSSDLKDYDEADYYVSSMSLVKFNIASLMLQYDKILYLDGDILVKDDVATLFSLDVSSVYLAAVLDIAGVLACEFHIRLNLPDYFNTGVLLMNLKKMREDKMEELLFRIKKDNPDYLCMDQDVFNVAIQGNFFCLPAKYNVMFFNYQHPAIGSIAKFNEYYKTTYRSFDDLLKKSCILHLTNAYKPWKYKDVLFHKEWMEVYRESPFCFQKLNLKYSKQQRLISSRIKHRTKQIVKRMPIIKQLLGRYIRLKKVLDENNALLMSIQNELNGKSKNKLDLERQLERLGDWSFVER